MGNFETRYPTNGSSALKPDQGNRTCGRIIEFPCAQARSMRSASHSPAHAKSGYAARKRLLDDLKGDPFEQLDAKSEALLGMLFAGVATLFVVLGM